MNEFSTIEKEVVAPFIPRWLENCNLTTTQYRMICYFWSCGLGRCFPSLETIASHCRINIKTVKSTLKDLEMRGLVTRTKRKAPGVRFCNEYILTGPNGAPVKSQPAQMEPLLTSPNGAPPNQPKSGPTKVTLSKVTKLKEEVSDDGSLSLPFDSDAFREAWGDWRQHRIEKRKPITPLSAKKSLSDLQTMGEARAIAAINHSISNGWQGIFEPGPKPQPANTINAAPLNTGTRRSQIERVNS